MSVFQISEQDVERSSTLERSDIGKWCFVSCGCYEGFFDTEKEALECYRYVMAK